MSIKKFFTDFFEALEDPNAHIKRDILHCWQNLRLRVSPEDFLVSMASKKGYPVEIVAQTIINFEERQNLQFTGSTTYTPGVTVAPETQATQGLQPSYLYQGDIINEIATLTHILLACRTGAGKSTFLKALIHRILQLYPDTQFNICDPKTTDWLGLQFHPNTVTYLKGDEEKQLEDLYSITCTAFEELSQRKEQKQQSLLNRTKYTERHPYILLIDEWFTLYDKCKRNKKIGDKIIGNLNEIVSQGRELNVWLWVVSQSHLCGEIGFSSSMRHSFCPVGLGARAASFEPLWAMAGDANLFSSRRDRDALQQTLETAIRECGQNRVILTVTGTPKVSILPNLNWVHDTAVQLPGGSWDGSAGDSLKRSEVKEFRDVSDSLPTTTTDDLEGYAVLSRAVVALRDMGMSETRIIEDILRLKGRKFEKGKQILTALLEMGEDK